MSSSSSFQALGLLLGCALLLTGLSLPAQTTPEDFTIIVLPDTQFYSQDHPHILNSQTQWIANNAAALNIKYVIGTGDIVNNGSSIAQWQNADAAFRTLDAARVPYFLPPGNHDYAFSSPSLRDSTNFNSYFGPARYVGRFGWTEGFPAGKADNAYVTFTASGTRYLLLALENFPRQAAVDWAASVITRHPDKQVIITTHAYMFNDNFRQGRCDWNAAESFKVGADYDGDELWEALVRKHPNIFLVVSGHVAGVGRHSDLGANGNLIHQLLADYQAEAEGGAGYLRIMKFRPSLRTIEVRTYSPYKKAYRQDSANQFTLSMTPPSSMATSGTISGKVRDTNTCAAIGGATIASASRSTISGSNGAYSLSVAAPATVTLQATHSSFQSQTRTAEVVPGFAALLKFYLQSAPASGSCTAPVLTGLNVVICSPANEATTISPFTVSAASSSPNGISRTEVWLDGTKKYQVSSGTVNTSLSAPTGSHRLTVIGVEPSGNVLKKSVFFTVSAGSPSPDQCSAPLGTSLNVVICSPTEGATVAFPINVTAAASSPNGVKKIELWIDGLKRTETYASSLKASATAVAGAHRITVIGVEPSGTILKKSVYVTVR